MQIKNADGTVIDVQPKVVEVPVKEKTTVEEVATKEVDEDAEVTTMEDIEKRKVDPFEQWKLAEELIKMPAWELKYRFGSNDLKYIFEFFDYSEVYELIKGKDREQLVNQGDIIKVKTEELSDFYYAVIEMIGSPEGELSLVCMHCGPISKFFPISKNTKFIRVCGRPIKVKIDDIAEYIGHAKHIKLGW